ncbi:protein FAM234A [Amia ocellicauda]|uniref:protein FAM234A n=1 Tax=Amia ocellicauda TaxID=2972642 RepID=UPI0034644C29
MDNSTDPAPEAQPLKGGEGEAEVEAPPKKGQGCLSRTGFSSLSRWRTAAFFLSLFLCLTIVFAFSFIIPCPVRPVSLRTWEKTVPSFAQYDFLDILDTNKDKVKDILFAFKNSMGNLNTTCANQSLPSPCVFLTAVTGTNGDPLWERPLAAELDWAQCGLEEQQMPVCLVSHSNLLTALYFQNGTVRWQVPRSPELSFKPPVLSVPDLDDDGVSDLALVSPAQDETKVVLLSGKTGKQLGSEAVLDQSLVLGYLLHRTKASAHYLLFRKESGVYGRALKTIATTAKTKLTEDPEWKKKTNASTGNVPVYISSSVQYLVKATKGRSLENLLLVTTEGMEMIDGQSLETVWKVDTSTVLSEPSFGHYNKDGVYDVVIERDSGNNTKKITILDGLSGAVLWDVKMASQSRSSPRPTSVNTLDHRSVFIFWGKFPSDTNSTDSLSERFLYMLHPSYSKVLLEKSGTDDHIIAFKAALFEKGRHACYVMLTGLGPAGDTGVEGQVTLSKHRLKEDMKNSTVLRLPDDTGSDSDQDIKEGFDRLRFDKDT